MGKMEIGLRDVKEAVARQRRRGGGGWVERWTDTRGHNFVNRVPQTHINDSNNNLLWHRF